MTGWTSEPTLGDVVRSIWTARVSVLVGGILGLAAAVLFLTFSVPHYRITMLVAPSDRAPKADIKALLPDNPSFALQYLVNSVGSQDSTDFIRFENMLRGPSVAKVLLADTKIRDGLSHNGKFVFSGKDDVDTAQEVADLLDKDIVVEPVGNTPLRRVSFDHPSPEFGIYLLNKMYSATDTIIREEVKGQARERADYLQMMLGKVNNPDHRRALTALLMEQEHIQMILGANEPFAAIIAEPPSVSVKPWWPRKSLILAGFVFAGMVLGLPCVVPSAKAVGIPVSVIIAVKNEEKALPACLKALSAFDEVIVVDSASTDRTVRVAQEYGASVVQFHWNGQYPKKRQWCLDHVATISPWIFFVDADEMVTPRQIDEIEQLSFDCAGYFVKGRYIWNAQPLHHGLKNNKIVLFDRRKFEFPVVDDLDLPGMGEMEGHYQPVLKTECPGEKIGQLSSELDHFAAQSDEQWLTRHQRYAAWERGMNERKAWPKDPVAWRQVLKTIFRAMPSRGAIAFAHCYIWKRGYKDGAAGFDFARKRAAYYKMISSCRRPNRSISSQKSF